MNTDINPVDIPANDIIDSPDSPDVNPEPVNVPAPTPAGVKRNQHLKVDEPKNKQLTGRATEREFQRINRAIEVRRKPGQTYDCIRLLLDCLNYIEDDIFQTFKTK